MTMPTTVTMLTPGAAQRRAARFGGAAATGVAGLLALFAHGDVVPVLLLSVAAAAVVYARPHGNLPAFGFVLVVWAWVFCVPDTSVWSVVAAAALVAAHALLAVGDATRGAVPLPDSTLGRLVREGLVVVAIACAAGLVTVARHTAAAGTHILLGVVACVLVAGWVAWLQTRPTD